MTERDPVILKGVFPLPVIVDFPNPLDSVGKIDKRSEELAEQNAAYADFLTEVERSIGPFESGILSAASTRLTMKDGLYKVMPSRGKRNVIWTVNQPKDSEDRISIDFEVDKKKDDRILVQTFEVDHFERKRTRWPYNVRIDFINNRIDAVRLFLHGDLNTAPQETSDFLSNAIKEGSRHTIIFSPYNQPHLIIESSVSIGYNDIFHPRLYRTSYVYDPSSQDFHGNYEVLRSVYKQLPSGGLGDNRLRHATRMTCEDVISGMRSILKTIPTEE